MMKTMMLTLFFYIDYDDDDHDDDAYGAQARPCSCSPYPAFSTIKLLVVFWSLHLPSIARGITNRASTVPVATAGSARRQWREHPGLPHRTECCSEAILSLGTERPIKYTVYMLEARLLKRVGVDFCTNSAKQTELLDLRLA